MVHEPDDGEDTIEWIAQQPWCDGNVGTYGASYLGFTQLASASRNPAALRAIAPAATSSDYYTAPWYSPGGALSWHLIQFWATMMAATDAQRAESRGAGDKAVASELAGTMADPYAYMTPAAGQKALARYLPWWSDMLGHPSRDGFWQDLSVADRAENITVPALHIAGWFDLLVDATVRTYRQLRARAGTAEARRGQQLIIGPWDHMAFDGLYPDRQFPMASGALFAGLTQVYLDFYDRWVRGNSAGAAENAPVRIFVMGIDEWRDEQEWPLADTTYADYYLTSVRGANTAGGDGLLTLALPAADARDSYIYDPADPVRTVGGRMLLAAAVNGAGPADQRVVEDRADVLCFTSAVLEEPVEVTGHVTLVLHVSSSAPDTDFTGKLADVYPDGRALYLTDGVMRTRYRSSLSAPQPMEPGQAYELTIDLSVTSNVFLPGHRIRLEVSSSNFPRYDRNTNTGGVISGESPADAVAARNTVLHGPSRPSRLILPVIIRDR
jgi:putative CocE/NonD family hydrolase